MITNDERREVAAKIRGNAYGRPFYGALVADAAGADPVDDEACWKRLADLIDPDNIPDNADENAHGLSGRCDRDALLALANEMDRSAHESEAYFACVHPIDILEYARRIREAMDARESDSDDPRTGDKAEAATDAHADGNEAADGARTPSIEVLRWVEDNGGIEAVKKRLMPEGMEWPKVDGKPVDFVTGYEPSLGVLEAVSIYSNGACEVMGHDGIIKDVKEIHVATPKVLDADGVEIRVGDRLYDTDTGCGRTVRAVNDNGTVEFEGYENRGWFVRFLTHRAPVLAADGKPLREGEHVYHVETGAELVVKELPKPGEYQAVVVFAPPASHLTSFDPDQLTHRAPVLAADGMPLRVGETVWTMDAGIKFEVHSIEGDTVWGSLDGDCTDDGLDPKSLTHERPDSWERLEDDAKKLSCEYFGFDGRECTDGCPAYDKEDCIGYKELDIVRRAKALAERSK